MNQLALAINRQRSTQKQDLLNYLATHSQITRMEAFNQLGICELPARICELEQDGYRFDKGWKKGRAANGRKWCVRTYGSPRR